MDIIQYNAMYKFVGVLDNPQHIKFSIREDEARNTPLKRPSQGKLKLANSLIRPRPRGSKMRNLGYEVGSKVVSRKVLNGLMRKRSLWKAFSKHQTVRVSLPLNLGNGL